jgi:hypothetical protein
MRFDRQALEIFRASGDQEALEYNNNIGTIYAALGDHQGSQVLQ